MRFHNFWCISFLSRFVRLRSFIRIPKKHFYRPENPSKLPYILPMSFSYNHGQKSWDTFAFLGVFQFTQVQPLPSHTNNVGCMYPEFFSEFQLCIGWGEGELQENFENAALTRLFGD